MHVELSKDENKNCRLTVQNMCSDMSTLLESPTELLITTAMQITCSLSPTIIIFNNKGLCVILLESLHLERRQQEKLTVGRIYCRGRDAQKNEIKLSLASSSRHFVVLTCTQTRHRVAERG